MITAWARDSGPCVIIAWVDPACPSPAQIRGPGVLRGRGLPAGQRHRDAGGLPRCGMIRLETLIELEFLNSSFSILSSY